MYWMILMVAALAATPALGEGAKFDIQANTLCEKINTSDPSLRKVGIAPPKKGCDAAHGVSHMADTWMGTEYPVRPTKGEPFVAVPVVPAPDDVMKDESRRICIRTNAEMVKGAYRIRTIDFWVVSKEQNCEGRESDSPFLRRFSFTLEGEPRDLCLMPNGVCLPFGKLHQLAQVRARTFIERVHDREPESKRVVQYQGG